MKEDYKIPCTECDGEMEKVSDIGGTVQEVRDHIVVGVRSLELWQCPKDKTVRVH